MAKHLISYIAPGAPATRRPADGDEPFLRPEIGFTPKWYRAALDIDFGERFHLDPAYRRECVVQMRALLRERFPDTRIGRIHTSDAPLDLLTGLFGGNFVAGLYGLPLTYAVDNWPNCEHRYLSDTEADVLEPPIFDEAPLFHELLRQLDWIAGSEGRIEGYINWQGILNTAYRLRGQDIFMDMMTAPDRFHRICACVCTTMTEGVQRLSARQAATGHDPGFITVSNCMVNMVSGDQYREFLLPYDARLGETFGCIGVHNCAWTATAYLEHYADVPHLAYIDMGLDSDLVRARELMPQARRALMYTPMDLANKPLDALKADFERIAHDYGPCDIVLADVEADTPDERVLAAVEHCHQISRKYVL